MVEPWANAIAGAARVRIAHARTAPDKHDLTAHPDRRPGGFTGHNIVASGLDIYFECGDEDMLHLQYGAEALHRQLFAHGIDHEYRLVRGANHLGPTLNGRLANAFRFIGRTLERCGLPPADPDPGISMFAAFVAPLEVTGGYRRTEIVTGPAGPIEVRVQGEGPTVVLVPSLGRGAADFDALAARLARAGYQAVAPEPRGIAGSTGPLGNPTTGAVATALLTWLDQHGVRQPR